MKKNKRKKPASVPYDLDLDKDLKDVEFAAHYLTECLGSRTDEDFDVFFGALKRVFDVHGVTNVANKVGLTRDALYKAVMGHKNPKFKTFNDILKVLDMEMAIVPRQKIG